MIRLDKFVPRDYQLAFFEAMENSEGKYRNAVIAHPRKTGKDFGIAFPYAIRTALRSTTNVLYMFKSYSQARDVIWEGLTNDGVRFLDTIPPECVESMNSSRMTITFKNNSMIKMGSAENYEKSIVGSNASLIIFSEYATYDNDNPYLYASPILFPRNGRFIFISTPRGRNHYYDLWVKAQQWDDWYCERLTLDDTKHISPELLVKLRREHSEEFIQQEYYCSFDRGIEGSFYAKYIQNAYNDGRIGYVPYDPTLPVHTAWDLGYNNTVIIYFQVTRNNTINIIDFDPQTNRSLRDWIKHVKSKDYVYGKHWAPHDASQHEYSEGLTRFEFARTLGLNFETREVKDKLHSGIPDVGVDAGIEQAMAAFGRISIDKGKCSYLIKALETYHREWDDEKKRYSQKPADDWSCHAADAFRYMCLVRDKNSPGMTAEDARLAYNQTMMQGESTPQQMPFPFNNDINNFGRGF